MPRTTVVSIQTAKAHFDNLLDRVSHGDEVVIALDGKPVARLAPVPPKAKPLPYGLLKGKLISRTNFEESLPATGSDQLDEAGVPPSSPLPCKLRRQRERASSVNDDELFFSHRDE